MTNPGTQNDKGLLGKPVRQSGELFTTVKKQTDKLEGTVGKVKNTWDNVRAASQALDKGLQKITSVQNMIPKSKNSGGGLETINKVSQSVNKVDQLLGKAGKVVDKTAHTIGIVSKTVGEVDLISNKINKTIDAFNVIGKFKDPFDTGLGAGKSRNGGIIQ